MDLVQMKTIAGLAAPAIAAVNFAYYMRSVIKGNAKPNFHTWLIWGMVMGIAGVAQMDAGAGAGAWMTLVGSALSFVRAGAAVVVGSPAHTTKSDQVCLLACMMAIVVWRLSGSSLAAIVIVTLIDLAAFYPAARQAWRKPWHEDAGTYALFAVQFSLGILALTTYSIVTVLYPLAICVGSLAFSGYILWRRQVLGVAKSV